LGPLLVALVLSGILCGCALVQTYVLWKLRTLVPRRTFQIHLAFLLLGVWQTVMTDYAQRPQYSYYLKANEGFSTSRVIDRMVLYISISALASGISVHIWLGSFITECPCKFSHELQHPDHQTTGQGQTIADNEECEEFERVSRPWM
ncbi:hypothetical protein BKA82DRAFT_4111801, partial [Pisolithus tinctorius]